MLKVYYSFAFHSFVDSLATLKVRNLWDDVKYFSSCQRLKKDCQSCKIQTIHLVCVVRPDWAWWHHWGCQAAGVSEINHMCIVPCIFCPGILKKWSVKIPMLLSAWLVCVVHHPVGELLHCWCFFLSQSLSLLPRFLIFPLFPLLFLWWCGGWRCGLRF